MKKVILILCLIGFAILGGFYAYSLPDGECELIASKSVYGRLYYDTENKILIRETCHWLVEGVSCNQIDVLKRQFPKNAEPLFVEVDGKKYQVNSIVFAEVEGKQYRKI